MEQIAASSDGLPSQVVRYGLAGAGVAALYAGVYWAAAGLLGIPAQAANAIGFLAALLVGYALHSSWTFKRGGGAHGTAAGRFLVVNIAGYFLNCFWVWLIVEALGRPVEHSVFAIVLVTPALTFLLNRRWTFA